MGDYVRDPAEIYRRSFEIIAAEADLSSLPPDLADLGARIVHACGMPDIVTDLAWSDGAGIAGRAALAAGAPIVCDVRMVAAGLMTGRLPGANPVLVAVDAAGGHETPGGTRTAAGLEQLAERLGGAIVVIGNAPTALFRLLDLVAGGAEKPALVLGFPVGFVGAAESKAALAENSLGVPFVTLRGRRGGSAIAAAAANALILAAPPAARITTAAPGRWLSIVGIGEDGFGALAPAARQLVTDAEILIGGRRHLAMVPAGAAERLAWPSPMAELLDRIPKMRGRRVVVLASGDPMNFGIGATLARKIPPDEMTILPAPSAFSLACARLGWPAEETSLVSLHGRPLETLALHAHPGARLLALTSDRNSPAAVAGWLVAHGFGGSRMSALAHLGGAREAIVSGRAEEWSAEVPDLHTLAVECVAGAGARWQSRLAGLADDAFAHDGKLTKREVRAAALARLKPHPGALLWDIGAGCGSIAIEWLRAADHGRAIALEPLPGRRALAAANALALGVPHLDIREGRAPDALAGLPDSDAVFFGGGLSEAAFDIAMDRLRPGGRLVAHAVTLESEALLLAVHSRHGGDLMRLAVSRAAPIGGMHGWRPAMPVTQWAWEKP